jgi:drug/metabolite transporter (DMT)-like permease
VSAGEASRRAGVAEALAAAVGFGLLGIFSKLAYTHGAGVVAVVAGRSLFMVPMLAVLKSPRRRVDAVRAWPELGAMAALMVFNACSYFVALSRMSPAAVTLIVYLYPAIVIAGSWALGRVHVRVMGVLAATFSLTGVAIIVGRPEGVDAIGVACAAANAFGYASYLIVSERALRRSDAVTAYAVCGGMAGAVLLAGAVALALAGVADDAFGGPNAAAAIAGVGIISTVAAGTLQLVAVTHLGSAPTSLITCLEIAVVVVVSALAFGDPITASLIAGAALVAAGAALALSVLRPAALPGQA